MERLLAWYRVSSSAGAVLALVAANLVPLVGVLWFGWSMWTILVIYWVENGIVGFFNVLKMAVVTGIGKLGVIPFFVVHYGMFWLVHGVFVFSLPTFAPFESGFDPSVQPFPPGPDGNFDVAVVGSTASAGIDSGQVALAAIGLFISHGLSYAFNFIRRGEYRSTTATELMFAPYRRVVILHLTILFGAFAVIFFGVQVLPLVILVTLKTAMDILFHVREHAGRAGAGADAAEGY